MSAPKSVPLAFIFSPEAPVTSTAIEELNAPGWACDSSVSLMPRSWSNS